MSLPEERDCRKGREAWCSINIAGLTELRWTSALGPVRLHDPLRSDGAVWAELAVGSHTGGPGLPYRVAAKGAAGQSSPGMRGIRG